MRYVLGLAVAASACGDNAITCGPGTMEMNGACVPADCGGTGTTIGSNGACVPICTGGLVLDPRTGVCVIGPAACAAPNVIVNGVCENPDHALMVDVDEGPEPNGLGLFGEASTVPAGTVALNPIGKHTVIHGRIIPFEDSDGDGQLDPDVDSYIIAVGGPTLVSITADGLGGLAAGFVAVAQVTAGDPLASWQRIGVSLATSSAQRQVYLPTTGTYILAIADTRTILLGPSGTAGGPDAEYYVIVDQLAAPTPVPLVASGGVATMDDTTSGDVKAYSIAPGSGLNEVRVTSPLDGAQLVPAFDVYQSGAFRAQAAGATGADALVGGFNPTDTATIVVDAVYDDAPMPAPFTLTVRTSSATALCSSVNCVANTATETTISTAPQRLTDTNQYYFDTFAQDPTGLAIAWDHPVQGSVIDRNGNVAAVFTSYGAGAGTWQSYAGLLQLAPSSRYYLAVFDPTATPGTTTLTATTTLAEVVTIPVTEGMPDTENVNAFDSNAFSYDAGTDPWHLFDTTGASTGGQHVEWYALDSPTLFGRLDPLAVTTGAGTSTVAGQAVPIFARDFAASGASSNAGCSAAGCGRVILSDGTTKYFVKVNATAPTTSPRVTLAFGPRTIVDLGAIASGAMQAVMSSASTGFFLFRTTAGNRATITLAPTVGGVASFQRANADETAQAAAVNATFAAPGSESFVEDSDGWTAFVVTDTTAGVAYNVNVAVQ